MFRIEITHLPSSKFGDPTPEALREPRLFHGFRTPTDRGRWGRGNVPDVVLYDEYKHSVGPKTWKHRESAETNVHHLIARGYTARVVEI